MDDYDFMSLEVMFKKKQPTRKRSTPCFPLSFLMCQNMLLKLVFFGARKWVKKDRLLTSNCKHPALNDASGDFGYRL